MGKFCYKIYRNAVNGYSSNKFKIQFVFVFLITFFNFIKRIPDVHFQYHQKFICNMIFLLLMFLYLQINFHES